MVVLVGLYFDVSLLAILASTIDGYYSSGSALFAESADNFVGNKLSPWYTHFLLMGGLCV
jgi:hypothetical protein